MPRFIDDSTFGDYFRTFQRTAWRLETRRGYASDRAGEKWQRWLRGEDIGRDPDNAWRANVREQTRQGRRFERVRLVDDPPTDGQRFLLASAVGNIAAGEDIRYLWRADAERLGLPAEDFWLFDASRALLLHFDQADEYLGAELLEDQDVILRYCHARDLAWRAAVNREEFAKQVPSPV